MDRLIEFVGNHIELSLAFVGLLFAFWFTEKSKSGQSLSPQQAIQKMNAEEAVVVDLREKKEFSDGHITSAIHFPYGSIASKLSELEQYKEKDIILVDKMGQHTGSAGKTLRASGFDKVFRLSGGIAEWRNANMPLVKK